MQQTGPSAFGAGVGRDRPQRGALNLFESASVGDLLGTGTPDVVKYELSLGQAANLLLVGQNFPYNHLIGAFDGSTGATLPAFPTVTDDYQFLSANDVAKLDPRCRPTRSSAGTGLGLLHAYDGATGLDVPGFPKQTGRLAGRAAGAVVRRADGRHDARGLPVRVADRSAGVPAEWPSFRHDQQDSGNYNHDGTPPERALQHDASRALGGGRYRLAFTAPGDDGPCGTPASYITRVGSRQVDLGLGPPVAGGSTFSAEITLPRGGRKLSIQAQDKAGNIGPTATVKVP